MQNNAIQVYRFSSKTYVVNSDLEIMELTTQKEKSFFAKLSERKFERSRLSPKEQKVWEAIVGTNTKPLIADSDICEESVCRTLINSLFVDTIPNDSNQGIDYLLSLLQDGFWDAMFRHSIYNPLITLRVYENVNLDVLSKLLLKIWKKAEKLMAQPIFLLETEDIYLESRIIQTVGKSREKLHLRLLVPLGSEPAKISLEDNKLGISIQYNSCNLMSLYNTAKKWKAKYPNCHISINVKTDKIFDKSSNSISALFKLVLKKGFTIDNCWLARGFAFYGQPMTSLSKPCGAGIRQLAISGNGSLAICRTALQNGDSVAISKNNANWDDFFEHRTKISERCAVLTKHSTCRTNCALWRICAGCTYIKCDIVKHLVGDYVQAYCTGKISPALHAKNINI